MINYISAGESHGKKLTGIITGLPSGLKVDVGFVDNELKLRQNSYGRGERQKLEEDHIEITSGLCHGKTTGAPLAFTIENKDNELSVAVLKDYVPRAGHADYTGSVKYDIPPMLAAERAGARSTAVDVSAGAILRTLLSELEIICAAQVVQVGKVKVNNVDISPELYNSIVDISRTRCADLSMATAIEAEIDHAAEMGDSVGGKIEVDIIGLPVGIGSYAQMNDRLDSQLAGSFMAIPAVKAVEFGLGTGFAGSYGSQVADLFYTSGKDIGRLSNNCGGIEGGISNGNIIKAFLTVKPIPTIKKTLPSVDIKTGTNAEQIYKRSDICAVPTAAIIARNVAAIGIARAISAEVGGSTLTQMKRRIKGLRA